MSGLEQVKRLLMDEGYTCVLSDGKELICSRERGVKPLMELIDGGKNCRGFVAADKVVGRAAALLYAFMGVAAVYARTVGEGALEVFARFRIIAEYDTVAPKIINRRGDDLCPMEKLTAEISDPSVAVGAIREKLKQMNRG